MITFNISNCNNNYTNYVALHLTSIFIIFFIDRSVLSHELAAVVPALFHDNGTIRRPVKSKSASYITNLDSPVVCNDDIDVVCNDDIDVVCNDDIDVVCNDDIDVEATVLDGCAVLS